MTIPTGANLAQRASWETLLRAAGAAPWKEKDIQRHMRHEQAAQPWVGIFYRVLGTHAEEICCAAVAMVGLTSMILAERWIACAIAAACVGAVAAIDRFFRNTHWNANWVYTYLYHRDWDKYLVPKQGQEVIDRILKLEPNAAFRVSFLGGDPVLWAHPSREGDYRKNGRAVFVWEENKDRTIRVISPPG